MRGALMKWRLRLGILASHLKVPWRGLRALIAILLFILIILYLPGLIVPPLLDSSLQQAIGDDEEPFGPLAAITLPPNAPFYVALGDSYSAGEGVVPYLPGTDDISKGGNRCHRSTQAYAQRLRFTGIVHRLFRACSGAIIANLHGRQTTGPGVAVPPQLANGVISSKVGLITITIGGNDAGFSHILPFCAKRPRCLSWRFNDSFDDGRKSGLKLRDWAKLKLQQISEELSKLYREIRAGAPNARIIVLGYPDLFPTGVLDYNHADCWGLLFFEKHGLLALEYRFNDLIRKAANENGLEFVPTSQVFYGHEACGGFTPRWMEFPAQSRDNERELDSGSFHPTRNGQAALARVITCHLTLRPDPNAPYTDYDEYISRLVDCASDQRTQIPQTPIYIF
jgi:lysophospholipase L1-like esterase